MHCPNATIARAGLYQSQEPKTVRIPNWVAENQLLCYHLLSLRMHMSRKIEWRGESEFEPKDSSIRYMCLKGHLSNYTKVLPLKYM